MIPRRYAISPNSTLISPLQTQWSSFYAPGAEIQKYFEDVVSKNDLIKYIKLGHELLAAHWEDTTGKWRMKIRVNGTNEIEDTADVLLLATGVLHRWQWPCIEGLSDFEGTLLHSANWKGEIDEWKDKCVGVIGAVGSIRVPFHSPTICAHS